MYQQIGTIHLDEPFSCSLDGEIRRTEPYIMFQNNTTIITDVNVTSLADLKKFNEQFINQTQLPFHAKTEFIGYVKDEKQLYPVYKHDKVTYIGTLCYWRAVHDQLIKELQAIGYKCIAEEVENQVWIFSNGENYYRVGNGYGGVSLDDSPILLLSPFLKKFSKSSINTNSSSRIKNSPFCNFTNHCIQFIHNNINHIKNDYAKE